MCYNDTVKSWIQNFFHLETPFINLGKRQLLIGLLFALQKYLCQGGGINEINR